MLPSIRLIAATFFCGFLLVFAGLRIAASLNDIHTSLPMMAAQAAVIEGSQNADLAARRGSAAMPVIYDLRFAPSGATLMPTLASLRPAAPPLDTTPPPTGKVSREELPAPAGSVEAKPKDETPVAVAAPEKPAPDEAGAKAVTLAGPSGELAAPAATQPEASSLGEPDGNSTDSPGATH